MRLGSRWRTLTLLGLLALVATVLYAHDLFIKLDSYFLVPNTRMVVPVLNGTFTVSENSIARDRILDLSVVHHGERKRLATTLWAPEGDTTRFTLQTGEAGTYVMGVSTKPRDLGLSAVDFNEYLEHDGIPDVLAERRRSGELAKDVVERYHKHVKAVLQVGDRRSDDFATPLGYPAEIVPVANPYSLQAGQTLRVLCLVDGNPVPNQLVIAGGEDADGRPIKERATRTDGRGATTVRLDRGGRWYVKFIHMVRSPNAEIDYESKWATLTFEIR